MHFITCRLLTQRNLPTLQVASELMHELWAWQTLCWLWQGMKTMRFRSWIVAALPVLLFACEAPDPAPAGRAPTAGELSQATYRDVLDEPIRLKDGVYEGEPYVAGASARPRVLLVDGYEQGLLGWGDLTGDGIADAAVLLAATTGGTGENLHLAVVRTGPNGPENVATALIGDRVKLRALQVENGEVVLDLLQAGKDDAMC